MLLVWSNEVSKLFIQVLFKQPPKQQQQNVELEIS